MKHRVREVTPARLIVGVANVILNRLAGDQRQRDAIGRQADVR